MDILKSVTQNHDSVTQNHDSVTQNHDSVTQNKEYVMVLHVFYYATHMNFLKKQKLSPRDSSWCAKVRHCQKCGHAGIVAITNG